MYMSFNERIKNIDWDNFKLPFKWKYVKEFEPFDYFSPIFLGLIILSIVYYNKTNETINKLSGKEDNAPVKETEKLYSLWDILKTDGVRIGLGLLPLIILFYLDINYSMFSMGGLRITKMIDSYKLNYMLRVLGAYGIVQVLAQDLGLKTGDLQGKLVKTKSVQGLIFFGTAYAITDNRSEALIGTLLYFYLKYIISRGETKKVCFEEV